MECLDVMHAMEGHLKNAFRSLLKTKCGPAPMKHLIHVLQPAVQVSQSRLNPDSVAPPLFPLFLCV